ncbi:MAG: hypothetical protein IPM85_02935 [Chitinophagaceae bacterium]|nr:hypothetical protein [Chitinophagaceae bacterium]
MALKSLLCFFSSNMVDGMAAKNEFFSIRTSVLLTIITADPAVQIV